MLEKKFNLILFLVFIITISVIIACSPVKDNEKVIVDINKQENENVDLENTEVIQTDKDIINTEEDIDVIEVYGGFVEEQLEIIMSSPKMSSNPMDYINEHKDAYNYIIEQNDITKNDDVLFYLLRQFEEDMVDGLRGQIILYICKDIVKDNFSEDENLMPKEWYQKYWSQQEIKLPDFTYRGDDLYETLFYKTEKERRNFVGDGFNIYSIHIFNVSEEENYVKIIASVLTINYNLYDRVVSFDGGIRITTAVTYMKDDNNYYISEYEQESDGSLEEICKTPVSGQVIVGLADKIGEYINSGEGMREIYDDLWENLKQHLNENEIYGCYSNGDILKLIN